MAETIGKRVGSWVRHWDNNATGADWMALVVVSIASGGLGFFIGAIVIAEVRNAG